MTLPPAAPSPPPRMPSPTLEVSAIAFDLDGTLLDTVHELTAAVNALLDELGYSPLDNEVVGAMIGKGMANLVRRALALASDVSPEAVDEAELKDALNRYQAHYASRLGHETRLFPGMVPGLARLREMAIPLAVITNKATRFVRPHLVAAGIEDYFSVVIGGDDLPTKKPDPAPLRHVAALFGIPTGRLLMVGDSGNDVEAARGAGCPVWVVSYGYREGKPVHELKADGIVESVSDLAERVRYVAPVKP